MKKSYLQSYYSAGILLYRYNNGKLEFLLGKDVKYNSWSDFGGKHDNTDKKVPLQTAIREFYEETCGVICNMYEMENIINKTKSTKIHCVSYKKKSYFMYIVKYEDDGKDIISLFNQQYRFLKQTTVSHKFKEKDEIKWFGVDSIIKDKDIIRSVFYNSFSNNLDTINRVTV